MSAQFELTDPQYAVDLDGTVRGWDVLDDGSDEGVTVRFIAGVVPEGDGYDFALMCTEVTPLQPGVGRFMGNSTAIREGCIRAWERWNRSFGGE